MLAGRPRRRKSSKTPGEDRIDADRPVAPHPRPWPRSRRRPTAGAALALLVLALAMAGVAIERWLFFAEAKHTVMVYYGAATA